MMKTKMIIPWIVLMLLSSHTWADDTFYKWEDENGSVHYTLTPPPKNTKPLGKMTTYRDFSYPIASPQNEIPYAQEGNRSSGTEDLKTPRLEPNNQVKPNAQYIPLPQR